jgi:enoyl-CoA hydratase/carnithine racemase
VLAPVDPRGYGAAVIRHDIVDEGLLAGLATITIDRAAKRNAMTYAMLGEFLDLVAELGRDDRCRVLVLTGVPGAFCAGTDLADLATIPGGQRGLRGSAHDTDRWWPLVSCPKPTIAAIDGPAVGMGAELASQCDIRIATPNARFAWNFAMRGLVPDTGAGTWLLPRLVGHARALRLLYTAQMIDADEAIRIGFLSEIVEPDMLMTRTAEIAAQILAVSPMSTRMIKALVYEGMARDVAEHMTHHTQAMAACFKSSDHAEGVASFLERRPAQFTGR